MPSVGKWKIATYILAATTAGSLWYGRGPAPSEPSRKPAARDAAYENRLSSLSRLRIPASLAGFDEDQLLRDLKGARSVQEIQLLCERLGIFGSDRSLETLEELSRTRPEVAGVAIVAMGGIGSDNATDRLIRLADSGRSSIMYWAVRGLAKTGNRRAHAQLFEWAEGERRSLRLASIDSLGEVRSEESLEVLVKAAKDSDAETLRRVLGAASMMATPDAVSLVLDIADRGNRQLRMSALRSMPRTVNAEQQEWLMDVLTASDSQCAALAAEALGRAKAEDALPLLLDAKQGTTELRRGAIRGLASLGGAKAHAALAKLFTTARASEAYELGRALLDTGGEDGRKSFLAVMKKGHPARAELIGLMHDFSGADVDALRLDLMKNGTTRERQNVAGQLLGSDNPEVATMMMHLAKYGSNNDRYAALNFLSQSSSKESRLAMIDIASGRGQASIEALRMLGNQRASDPEVQTVLLDALYSGVPNKVQTAGWALASSGSEDARAALLGALSSDNPMLANAAMSAINQLGSGPEVVEALQAIASDSDNPQLKSSALYQLANSQDPSSTDLVVQAISNGDSMAGSMVSVLLQRGGPEAKKVMDVALTSESPQTRSALANALGSQGGAEASAMLDTLLEDSDASVQNAAVYALGNLGSKEAGERLVELASSGEKSMRQTAISALGNSGDPRASGIIAEAITSGDASLVQTAIYSAHNAGPEVDEALLELADNTEAEMHLRQQAANTLINRGGADPERLEELKKLTNTNGDVNYGITHHYLEH